MAGILFSEPNEETGVERQGAPQSMAEGHSEWEPPGSTVSMLLDPLPAAQSQSPVGGRGGESGRDTSLSSAKGSVIGGRAAL